MTDNKTDNEQPAVERAPDKDKPEVVSTETVTATSEAKKPERSSQPRIAEDNSKKAKLWPIWLVILLLLIGLGVAGYFAWQFQQRTDQALTALSSDSAKNSQNTSAAMDQFRSDVSRQLAAAENSQQQQLLASLESFEQRLDQHSRRLRSLSTTSREDWLLAEAEYLIRLATQRLLMERQPQGALALLEGADQILLEIDDLDLFSVREKLARDITALKLVPLIDRSGLYLRLAAIADEVLQLPTAPRMPTSAASGKPEFGQSESDQSESSELSETSGYQQLLDNLQTAAEGIGRYIRVTRHDQNVEPLLPPDGGLYLRQNLRFMIERAQLALLREEADIYRHSLEQAVLTLQQYFSTQERAAPLIESLLELSDRKVAPELPNINGSLVALQDYIERLHQLDGEQPPAEESPQ